jgi:hypothetical protein
MRASLAIIVFGAIGGAVALTAGAPSAAADVTAACEFLEISAKAGDKPVIDGELKPVEKKLKKPPFSAWNQFKLLSSSKKSLSKKKAETIDLKVGAATATLIEIVDNSKLRLTVTMDDDKRKQVVNNTSTLEAGDYLMYVHSMTNNEGHLLSVTCR